MNTIRTVDNFLTKDEMKMLEEYFDDHVWRWGHRSHPKVKKNGPISKWFYVTFDDKPYFTEYLKEKIESITGMEFELHRVYANGQTISNDGDWHRDVIDDEKNDVFVTAILYVSDITLDNVDEVRGYTYFRLPNDDIVTIEPIKNRLVLFNSRVPHRGCAPSIPGFLRISLAWKLKRIK